MDFCNGRKVNDDGDERLLFGFVWFGVFVCFVFCGTCHVDIT